MLAPTRTALPASTPVSLDEAKEHLRIELDETLEDDLVTAFIKAATGRLDGWTGILGRALVTQTWRQDFAGFGCLRLPLGPVASITEIKYYDSDNVQRTLADTVYTYFTDARGAYVALKSDQSWPGTYSRSDAVSVTFVAGEDDTNVPAPIKTAILLMVGNWYANRESVVVGTIATSLPMGVDDLIAPYRKVGV